MRGMAIESQLARRSICQLETIGRRTGKPHLIDIWFAADPARDRIYFLSGGRDGADWLLNLRRQPSVRVRIADRWFGGRASEIEDGPDDGLARRLLGAKYQAWTPGRRLSSWARNSLPVAVDLLEGGAQE
jgi:deazaflavin-dependent oxidoreductase (nitroreductase family)